LIKPCDLIEEISVETINKQDEKLENCYNNVERYAKNLCGRIDTNLTTDRGLLLLNKPIKPNVHSVVKAKNMSLKESVILQILHENKIKVSFKLMGVFF